MLKFIYKSVCAMWLEQLSFLFSFLAKKKTSPAVGRPQTTHKLSQARSFPDIQHRTTEHREQNTIMIIRTEKSKSYTSCVNDD